MSYVVREVGSVFISSGLFERVASDRAGSDSCMVDVERGVSVNSDIKSAFCALHLRKSQP